MSRTEHLDAVLNIATFEPRIQRYFLPRDLEQATAELAQLHKYIDQLEGELAKEVSANIKLRAELAQAPEGMDPVEEWQMNNSKLRAEIDRYDKICTEIRNVLTVAAIPELTEDRLTVLPLATRVYLLATLCATKMTESDQLSTALGEAKKILRAFYQHDDYIGRKTVMTVAEEWLKKNER